jgi:hypothetical protein
MTQQKFLQNGEKTTIEPKKKSEGAAIKEKDISIISQHEEL